MGFAEVISVLGLVITVVTPARTQRMLARRNLRRPRTAEREATEGASRGLILQKPMYHRPYSGRLRHRHHRLIRLELHHCRRHSRPRYALLPAPARKNRADSVARRYAPQR